MARQTNTALYVSVALLGSFVWWSYIALRGRMFIWLDASSLVPGVDFMSYWGQILTAVATLTAPVVVYVVMAVMSVWTWHKRLKNLAFAWLVVVIFSAIGIISVKGIIERPRPELAAPVITTSGWAFPSGHMTAITSLTIMAVATAHVAKRPLLERVGWIIGGLVIVSFVGYNRWALRAHWFTDIIGGVLFGGFLTFLSLALTRVRIAPTPLRLASPPSRRMHCAVIVNPTKVPDWAVFRVQVEGAASENGWTPLWLETRVDDPGHAAAIEAVARGADLVLAVGGDGTVRAVCAELVGTGIPIALVPAGTGNLLARNLGVPLDLAAAIDVAFEGRPILLDVVEIRADGGPADHSVVMAGIGLDAIVMDETRPELKRVVGAGAYLVAGLQSLNRPPFRASVTVDDGAPQAAMAGSIVIANVGSIQGNIQLFPEARGDDGIVDVLVVSPTRPADWGIIASHIVRGSTEDDRISRDRGARIVIETVEPIPYQIDGDTAGQCSRLEATVVPRAVSVMVP